MSYFSDIKNREPNELVPGVFARSFWQEKMMMVHVTLEPHAVVPMHSHPHEQGGTVLSGQATFTIGDETREVEAGAMYIIPGGVEHKVIAGPDGAVVVDIFVPIREEYK